MRHAHRLIIGEVNAEATGDLLRTRALSPAPVPARSMTSPAPADLRTRRAPVGPLHSPGKPGLHIGPQLRVDRELRRLGSTGASVGMRRGSRGSIFRTTAADRCVALQLPGDRRRRPTQPTRDLPHPTTTSEQHCDLLSLGERQKAPRHRREGERGHAATLAEPPDTNTRQDARSVRWMHLERSPQNRRAPPCRRTSGTRPGCSSTIKSTALWASQLLNVRRCDHQLNPPNIAGSYGARPAAPSRYAASNRSRSSLDRPRPSHQVVLGSSHQRRRHQQQLTTITATKFKAWEVC